MTTDVPYGLPTFDDVPPTVWDGWQDDEARREKDGHPTARAVALGLVGAGLLLILTARRAD